MNAAFTSAEQSAILLTDVDNSKNQGYSGYSTHGGNNTRDRIFLLSYAEANKYFGVQHYRVSGSDNNVRSRAAPTAYALKNGVWKSSGNETVDGAAAAGWWWLRSPGFPQSYAARVDGGGSLNSLSVDYDSGCVRPAFWLNLDSDIF